MSILGKSSAHLRQRLLDLYPVAKLREQSGQKGRKEGIAHTLSSSSDPQKLAEIADFLDTNFRFCKQHIYVFSHDGEITLPESIPDGEMVKSGEDHALYLAQVEYKVVKLDALQKDSIEFLWPVRIEVHGKHLLMRFVVLEKNVSSYFDGAITIRGKSLSEEAITGSLLSDGTVGRIELNKGFKALWESDKIDAIRVRYKEPDSVVSRYMDEAKGLKQTNPAKYDELIRHPLHKSVFIPRTAFAEVGPFTADPTGGFIGFSRYFKEGASGDELIRQILANN